MLPPTQTYAKNLISILLFPVLAIIAVCIKLQSIVMPAARGPVLISEQRISQGTPFAILKFCTYFVQEDELHAHKRGTTDFINDRNVTPVGRMPQLWNILLGQMSFIGPRPVPAPMYREILKQGYQCKRVLRAGLGGPVQVLKGQWKKYGSYLDADEDLIADYSRRSAVGVVILDLAIMWRTFRKAQEGDGLYPPYR